MRCPCPGRLGNALGTEPLHPLTWAVPDPCHCTEICCGRGWGTPRQVQGSLDLLSIKNIFLQLKMGKKWAGCKGFSSPVSIKWELQEHHQAQASKVEPEPLEVEIMTHDH